MFLLQVIPPAGRSIRHSPGGGRVRSPPRCARLNSWSDYDQHAFSPSAFILTFCHHVLFICFVLKKSSVWIEEKKDDLMNTGLILIDSDKMFVTQIFICNLHWFNLPRCEAYLLCRLWTWSLQATVHALTPRTNQIKARAWLRPEQDADWLVPACCVLITWLFL